MGPKRRAQDDPAESSATTSKRKTAKQTTKASSQDGRAFEPYPCSKVYRLIEPGPVLLVTTGSLAASTHNIMTIGFHMVMQHESPPLIGISLGPWDASFALLKKYRECVLTIPSVEIAEMVVDIGNCSAADEDGGGSSGGGGGGGSKWERFGLEALPADRVQAPLVGDPHVIANIECVVEDTKMVSKYSMWVLKPVKAWINPNKRPGEGGRMFHHRGDGTFVVDGEVLDLKDRMTKWKDFQD
ncbi:hypothetical protein BX600DRAFT_404599 [Xylariales sp. PMI_506]|nr:hypothetical protein BX600DRAFT_404599 [Xylariales sp. PMI_506]